jgi:hypothetical protein
LARILNESPMVSMTRLSLFWLWCMKYAKDGDLTNANHMRIEQAVKWTGEAGLFMQALLESGFVDWYQNGAMVVHDWDKYGGKLIKKQQADANRKKASNGNSQNSGGIPTENAKFPHPSGIGNLRNSAGIPPENPEIPYGNPQNSDVRKEENRLDKSTAYRAGARDDTPPTPETANHSATPLDLREPLTRSVLEALGKFDDFNMGTRSPNDYTMVVRIVTKMQREHRTPEDVKLVADFWPVHLNKPPEQVQPMTTQQFLSQFDNLHARAMQPKSTPGSSLIPDPEELKKRLADVVAAEKAEQSQNHHGGGNS